MENTSICNKMKFLKPRKVIYYAYRKCEVESKNNDNENIEENIEVDDFLEELGFKTDDKMSEINATNYIRSKEVAFCPCCKKMCYSSEMVKPKNDKENFLIIEGDYIFGDNYKFKRMCECKDESLIITCPNCKKDLTGYLPFLLSRGTHYNFDNSETKSYYVYKEKDKIIFVIFFYTYFPATKPGKIIVKRYNFRVVFNTKTGQTYILEVRETDGKKRKPKWFNYSRITNCTYNGSRFLNSIYTKCLKEPEILGAMGDALVDEFNRKKSDLYETVEIEYFDKLKNEEFRPSSKERIPSPGKRIDELSFSTLCLFNRFNMFSRSFLNDTNRLLNNIVWNYSISEKEKRKKKKFLKDLAVSANEEKLFEMLYKKFGIPNKKGIKKLVYSNPLIAMEYSFFVTLGFKDYNIIMDMLSNYEYIANFHKSFNESNYEDDKKNILIFLNTLLEKKGEPVTKKLLFAGGNLNYSFLRDTANMYVNFKKHNLINNNSLKGTLKEIHDRFALDYQRIKERNINIVYSDDMYDLNDEIDGYSFVLAEGTHQLIEVGQAMGICVGNYGKRAVSKDLIIVLMINNNKYVGCIELNNDGKRLVQAKAKFNNLLQEKKAEALRSWITKKEIDASTCYDYEHIKNNEIEYDESKIYQRKNNYAFYGVRNYNYALDPFGEDFNGDLDDFLQFD